MCLTADKFCQESFVHLQVIAYTITAVCVMVVLIFELLI